MLVNLCFLLMYVFLDARPSAWHIVASQVLAEKDELVFFSNSSQILTSGLI